MITSVKETRFHGANRNFERACHFREVELQNLVKDECLALGFGKLHECDPQNLSVFRVREAGRKIRCPFVQCERKSPYPTPAQELSKGNTVDPRAKAGFATEAGKPNPCLDERLLSQIFRVLIVPSQHPQVAKESNVVPLNKLRAGNRIGSQHPSRKQ